MSSIVLIEAEGMRILLSVFLDHVLCPTLTDEAFGTLRCMNVRAWQRALMNPQSPRCTMSMNTGRNRVLCFARCRDGKNLTFILKDTYA